jgi:hypothetical protein
VKITILSPLWENKVDFSRPPMLFSLAEFGEKTGQNTTTGQSFVCAGAHLVLGKGHCDR